MSKQSLTKLISSASLKKYQKGRQKDVIVMDFSKAFDKVDNHTFFHKRKYMRIIIFITTLI